MFVCFSSKDVEREGQKQIRKFLQKISLFLQIVSGNSLQFLKVRKLPLIKNHNIPFNLEYDIGTDNIYFNPKIPFPSNQNSFKLNFVISFCNRTFIFSQLLFIVSQYIVISDLCFHSLYLSHYIILSYKFNFFIVNSPLL